MFTSREQALKFENKLMNQFLVRGKKVEDYISDEISETYYYCDKDLMLNHKEEMLKNGWEVDLSKGEKETIYSGATIDDEWSYDRLIYRK